MRLALERVELGTQRAEGPEQENGDGEKIPDDEIVAVREPSASAVLAAHGARAMLPVLEAAETLWERTAIRWVHDSATSTHARVLSRVVNDQKRQIEATV